MINPKININNFKYEMRRICIESVRIRSKEGKIITWTQKASKLGQGRDTPQNKCQNPKSSGQIIHVKSLSWPWLVWLSGLSDSL